MPIRFAPALALAIICLSAAGCGESLASATIAGEVQIDGKPMAKGIIAFAPADGKGAPATANVENGKYTVTTTAGPKTVQISSMAVIGQRKDSPAPDAPMVDIVEEVVPDKYNAASELKFEAKPGGNTKDWSVEGRGRGKK